MLYILYMFYQTFFVALSLHCLQLAKFVEELNANRGWKGFRSKDS